MAVLPESIKNEWDNREGPIVFTTVSPDGAPNAIYAGCVSLFGDDMIIVADNYFDKTRANILAGSKGAILFITKERKAFQVKGAIEYHRDGPVFDDMQKWKPERLPGHAAAALRVEEVYSGAEKLL